MSCTGTNFSIQKCRPFLTRGFVCTDCKKENSFRLEEGRVVRYKRSEDDMYENLEILYGLTMSYKLIILFSHTF